MTRSDMLLGISRKMAEKYQSTELVLPDYNPLADFFWIQHQSKLPWLKLPILVPTDDILQEIPAIQSHLIEHREDYGEHQGWKSFCIHGKSYDATREDQYYSDDRPHIWTSEAKKFMPNTVKFFQNHWPGSTYSRIRMMLLEPGGYITLHSDSDRSKLSPINIAITQPSECKFIMEKQGVVPFSPGAAFWLNVSNRHAVFNDSDQPRWHIIVHQNCDHPEFKEMVVKCYHTLYNNNNETSHTDHPGRSQCQD